MAIFVVQKHAAATTHYDFRLEIGGVLKSWVIPKGPSMDSQDKRLAIPTDDHALAYADFEGSVPEGEYGAGKVLIWDKGSFENLSHDGEEAVSLEDAYEAGHISVELKGQKLHGKFTLVKTHYDHDHNWLLLKHHDEITKEMPRSVHSGKRIEEL
jgi:DNA ligase D-like protein (predicted 3'-phosphoesterase)